MCQGQIGKAIIWGCAAFIGTSGFNFNICMIDEKLQLKKAKELYGAKHISEAPKPEYAPPAPYTGSPSDPLPAINGEKK